MSFDRSKPLAPSPTLPIGVRRALSPKRLLFALVLSASCTVSDLDYSGRTCDRAVDCPAPYVCVVARGAQSATCVTADQGVPTTDGGVCDVTNVSFSQDIQPIFNVHCTDAGCHGASGTQGDLLLAGPGTRSRLVNQPTSADCNAERPNVLRVKPGDRANSMLWRKTSNDPTKCLAQMPPGRPLISLAPCQFAKLEAWIQQGALEN